ncbi:MAG: adenine phosphoribosyltransferase [Planctomycetota bacterium]
MNQANNKSETALIAGIDALIRDVPDFPKPGIVFKDITPLLSNALHFAASIKFLADRCRAKDPQIVAGPEARGFLFGVPVAMAIDTGFAPIRKKGKLPYRTIEESYELEYGKDTVAVHADAFSPGQKVILVDDVLATGGTMAASKRLVEKCGATVVGAVFLIELGFLDGRSRLDGLPIESLIRY